MLAHLLFHVVECLVLPTLIAIFSGNLHREAIALTAGGEVIHETAREAAVDYNPAILQRVELTLPTGLTYYYPLKLPN